MRLATITLIILLLAPLAAQDTLEQFGHDAVEALKSESFVVFGRLQIGEEDISSLADSLHASHEWRTMLDDDRLTADQELRNLQTALIEPDSDSRVRLRNSFNTVLVRGTNLYGFDWATAGFVDIVPGTEYMDYGVRSYDNLVVIFEAGGAQYRLAFGQLIRTGHGWRLGPEAQVYFVVQ